MKTPPCKNCTDRQMHCRSQCEKYKTWQTEHISQKVNQKRERNKEATADTYMYREMLKNAKRKPSAY